MEDLLSVLAGKSGSTLAAQAAADRGQGVGIADKSSPVGSSHKRQRLTKQSAKMKEHEDSMQ